MSGPIVFDRSQWKMPGDCDHKCVFIGNYCASRSRRAWLGLERVIQSTKVQKFTSPGYYQSELLAIDWVCPRSSAGRPE